MPPLGMEHGKSSNKQQEIGDWPTDSRYMDAMFKPCSNLPINHPTSGSVPKSKSGSSQHCRDTPQCQHLISEAAVAMDVDKWAIPPI